MDSDVSKTKRITGKLNKNNEDDEVCLPQFLHCLVSIGGCRNELCNDKRKTIRNFTLWK
ncbi:MAG: hypothetical protein E6Z86_19555 [Clostridium butyricum]|nr:hypothetical protein [Clostridium butyricum]MDU5821989.1 hypothetical protein [Clostridium butyricum]